MAWIATNLDRRHVGWRPWTVVALVCLIGAAAVEAQAASRVCAQLESQLSETGGGSRQAARYDAAITKQQEQMRKAREQARRAGCGTAIFGSSVAACASLNTTIDKMRSNLASLEAKRATMGGSGRERARILAALQNNGCRQAVRAKQEDAAEPRQRVVIGGGSERRIGNLSGSFRTLCVRTCDGYFFPISYGVSASAFERDQNACAAMCPGTRVELYYHRVPGQEPVDMMSVSSGLPYTQMTNAWRYRDSNAESGCGCGAAASRDRGFEVIGGSYTADTELTESAMPLPDERPDPAEDPETLANRAGGLMLDRMRRLAKPRADETVTPAGTPPGTDRPVRVVGPAFLPDPAEATDQPVPDQTAVR